MTIDLRNKTTARLFGSAFALVLAASPLSLTFDNGALHLGPHAAFAKDGGSGGSGGGSSGSGSGGSGEGGHGGSSGGSDHSGPGRGGDGGGDDGGRGAVAMMMAPTTTPVTIMAAMAPSISAGMAPRSRCAATMSKSCMPAASRKKSKTAAMN